MPSVIVSRAKAPKPLEIVDGITSWAGPVDDEVGAPIVAWTCALFELAVALDEGDAKTVGDVVTREPMPRPLLDALAERCVKSDRARALAVATGREISDLRWARALVRAFIREEGAAPTLGWSTPQIVLTPRAGRGFYAVRALAPERETMLALEDPTRDASSFPETRAWIIPRDENRHFVDIAAHAHTWSRIPEIVAGAREAIVVLQSDYDRNTITAWQLDREARCIAAWHAGAVERVSNRVSLVGDRLWLHADEQHILLDARHRFTPGAQPWRPPSNDAQPPARTLPRDRDEGRILIVGHHLLVFDATTWDAPRGWISPRARWIDLAGDDDRPDFPWDRAIHRAAIFHGALWVATERSLMRLSVDEPPREIPLVDARAMLVEGDRILAASGERVVELDADGRELRSIAVGHNVDEVHRVGASIVALGWRQWTWLDAFTVRATSGERREVGRARLRDGTFAASAGEEVLVLCADGALAGRVAMPWEGRILGATSRAFVYGAIDDGFTQRPPDGLYAIDAHARVVDRIAGKNFPPPAFDDDAAWIARDTLIRFTPKIPADSSPSLLEAPARRPTERDAEHLGFDTINPRDEWPEPGVFVDGGDYFALGCTFGGTTGVSPDIAVRVDHGAIATLVDCALVHGGGVHVRRGSTLFLVGCRDEGEAQVSVEPGSHVVRIA